jgi:hypothetical protein
MDGLDDAEAGAGGGRGERESGRPMSGYVIATQSRRREETLFMVDRAKESRSFWSNHLTHVFVYASREAAQARAAGLIFNSPCVLSLEEARRIACEQENGQMYDEAMMNSEEIQ